MDWWQEDLKDMVDKDFNHPSVIMYSTGNEVSETAQKKGIELTGRMTRYLHELDSTRPVTCGVNIFFNFLVPPHFVSGSFPEYRPKLTRFFPYLFCCIFHQIIQGRDLVCYPSCET
jgi:hypothetical protein